jgi:hypothetical protein
LKAIYKGKLYYVIETEWENIQLRGKDGVITVDLADPDLIIDPTDDEVSHANKNQS